MRQDSELFGQFQAIELSVQWKDIESRFVWVPQIGHLEATVHVFFETYGLSSTANKDRPIKFHRFLKINVHGIDEDNPDGGNQSVGVKSTTRTTPRPSFIRVQPFDRALMMSFGSQGFVCCFPFTTRMEDK